MAPARVPSVGYLVWHLAMRWRVEVDRVLAPLGLTNATYGLLASLYALTRHGARPSQRELADFAGLDVMYVSKLVRPVERAGWLTRDDHPRDPRAFALVLTRDGEVRIVQAAALVRALYARLLRPLGGPDSPKTAGLMRTLNRLLDDVEAGPGRDAEGPTPTTSARRPAPARTGAAPRGGRAR